MDDHKHTGQIWIASIYGVCVTPTSVPCLFSGGGLIDGSYGGIGGYVGIEG
jgi:hypothetical protein